MSRVTRFALVAAALALPALPAAAGEAYTTRIEPRPFYGATVTLEEGVRVFRPLPTTRHVIVNPGGKTPLNLSIEDVRVTEHRYGGGGASASAGASAGSSGGVGGYYVPRRSGHSQGDRSGAGMPAGGVR